MLYPIALIEQSQRFPHDVAGTVIATGFNALPDHRLELWSQGHVHRHTFLQGYGKV